MRFLAGFICGVCLASIPAMAQLLDPVTESNLRNMMRQQSYEQAIMQGQNPFQPPPRTYDQYQRRNPC